MAATCDVLVYNVRPQAMARLGLSYAEVAQANPSILYVGMYGYDQRGPYAARAAYDDLIQGPWGFRRCRSRRAATYRATRPAPWSTASSASAPPTPSPPACTTAPARARAGHRRAHVRDHGAPYPGRPHDGPDLRAALGPPGYPRILNADRRPYATRNGHICVLLYADKHWKAFFELIGQPGRDAADPRFRDIGTRTQHIHAIYRLVSDAIASRTTEEWLAAFEAADIPAMPVHTMASLLRDPHLEAIGFFGMVDHPSEGAVRMMAVPSRWSGTPPQPRGHAPRLGEHSVDVLKEAGYDDEAIAALVRNGRPSPRPASFRREPIMTDFLRHERHGGVLLLTMDRERTRNALSDADAVEALVRPARGSAPTCRCGPWC